MAAYVSPGVYVIEKDWSDYTPSLNSTNVGVMGFASQGPVGKATLVTNADQLVQTFGRPDDAEGGFGLIGAYHILDRTNTVYFTRTATTDAAVADVAVPLGTCPYVELSGLSPNDYHLFLVDVSGSSSSAKNGSPLIFSIPPASANATYAASAAKAIEVEVNRMTTNSAAISWDTQSASAGNFVGSYAGSGANVQVWGWASASAFPTIPPGTEAANINSLSGSNADLSAVDGNLTMGASNGAGEAAYALKPIASGVTVDPTSLSGGAYVTRTLYPGAGYNYSSTVETYGQKITGLQDVVAANRAAGSVFNVNKGSGAEESHLVECVVNSTGVDLAPSAVINNTTDSTNKTSDFIVGEFAVDNTARDDVLWALPTSWGGAMDDDGTANLAVVQADATTSSLTVTDVRYLKLVDGRYNYAGGNNGDLSGSLSFDDATVRAAVIGNAAEGTVVYSYLKEDVDISILAIPGCTEQNIVNNAISIAESSQEFLVVTNPPLGINSPQNAIAWSNGVAEGRTAALNSSYACIYWPWVKLFNPFTQVDEYISPDIFAIRQMAFTDATFDAWFAPAGLVRGRLTKPVDVEMVLTQGDRDALYGPGNVVNPVQKFLTEGIVLWGQRTTQRVATALDRINVRRLMIIIRKMLLASTRQFVFEPNDAATWKRVENAVEPLMADIKSRRGVVDFKVICDSTTNTPIRIDRNELWCKVILQPTKAAEVIVFELNLTSATLGLGLPGN